MRSFIPVSLVAATILVLGLSCIVLAGCGGGEQESPVERVEEAGVEEVADESGADTEIELESANNSGASGTATLTDAPGGVEVKLDLRGLPNPGATYLAHLHPGTCGEEHADHDHVEAGKDHGHDGTSAEEARSDEIDYPLTPVGSDAEGNGSSMTLLEDATVEMLTSGEPKYINVHAAGSGDDLPPDIVCGGLS